MTALEYLKNRQNKNALALIMHDDYAKRLLVAWTFLPRKRFQDFELPHEENRYTESDVLRWAWRSVNVDEVLLASLADMPPRIAREKFKTLKTAALIFPDGSVYDIAMRVVKNEVAAAIAKTLPIQT